MTGSVHAALEVTDSKSGELLFAAVRHRAPNALDIESTLSTEKTVEAVAQGYRPGRAQGTRSGERPLSRTVARGGACKFLYRHRQTCL